MSARDEPQPGDRLAAERLGALGLAPRPSRWVPDQPASVPTVTEPAPHDRLLDTQPPGPALGDALRAAIAARLPLWAADRVERASPGTILLVLAVFVTLGIVGVVHLRHHPPAGSGSYVSTSSYATGTSSSSGGAPDPGAPAAAAATTDATSIIVDVGGRVRKPGLVTLPLGARVSDAIAAAGGPLRRRELDRIDLAQRVSDGEFLLVGVSPAAGDPSAAGGSAATAGAPSPVSLSTATIDQLETLPGVGPVTAQKIIDWRTAHGGFSSVDQLNQVPGIGPAHFAEISPLVTP